MKNSNSGRKNCTNLPKILIKMKLTLLLFLSFGFVSLASQGYAQEMRLDINLKDATLKQVIQAIEQQSQFSFFYKNDQIDVEKRVTLKEKNAPIQDILNKALAGTDLTYTVVDRIIVIRPNKFPLQPIKVEGKVTDEQGNPLPGVNIIIKGTQKGTMTGGDGTFMLDVPEKNAILVFSFVGYETKEVPLNGRTTLNVTLKETAIGLQEVVTIAYGTQKKINLTGSVDKVTSKEIENRPVTQLSQALTGQVPGMTIMQRSGKPGADAGTIRIRGVGTFSNAGKAPMVLVDGIEASLNDIDPNDIESISVLKDAASAAIYGSRAANGLILITTKSGKPGKFRVTYNGYAGWTRPTKFPEYLGSADYARLYNEALENDGSQPMYTEEEIRKFEDGSDPDNYPDTDWLDLVFSGSGFQTKHDFNFSGGSKTNTYSLSVGYLNQKGLVPRNYNKRYSFRLNLNSQISKKLELIMHLSAIQSELNEPIPAGHSGAGYRLENIVIHAVRIPPTIPAKTSEGYYGFLNEGVPYGWIESNSFKNNKIIHLLGNINLNWEITEGLTVTGILGYRPYINKEHTFAPELVVNANKTQGPAEVFNYWDNNNYLTLQALVNYDKTIDIHHFHILGGYTQESYTDTWTRAYRDNLPNNSLNTINAGSEENMKAWGSGAEFAMQSVFGRFNYDLKNRYLLEINVRADGSSRFAPGNRWGIFPSISGAWILTEENFLNDIDWLNVFKVRLSWGVLGNQNIGTYYPYQSVYVINGINYSWGGSLIPGAAANTLPNKNITWETTQTSDIGLDMSLLDRKLDFTFDYFHKVTSDILYNISTSSVLGLTPSEQNAGKVLNRGIELSLDYNDHVGNFRYGAALNFSYIHNEVLEIANIEKDIAKGLFVGYPLESYYGYLSDGLFVDQNDVDTYPTQPYNAQPGDIRYKDISGPDGVPDGQVDPNYDRTVIGSRIPKYTYNGNLSLGYKNLDFSVQLQGVAGVRGMLRGYAGAAFYHKGKAQKWHLQRWTKENPNRWAPHPRVQILSNAGEPNLFTSDFWARNASYLRIKNMQIGYSLPKKWLSGMGVNKLRVYFSADNVYTFDSYYPGWDPEINTGGYFYPITATFTFGLNLVF